MTAPTADPGILPEGFFETFKYLAETEFGPGPAEPDFELDMFVSDQGTRVYLSNDMPGWVPYLQVVHEGGTRYRVQVCSRTTSTGSGGDSLDAEDVIDFTDLTAAARKSIELWHTTL